jgi:hypothetical protein
LKLKINYNYNETAFYVKLEASSVLFLGRMK